MRAFLFLPVTTRVPEALPTVYACVYAYEEIEPVGGGLMDILERNRILNELQQQLASGEITIGGAVRRLRKEVTGLQQARFAQMCKLSLRALRQLELDESNPTVQTLNSVFNPFGMQVGIVPKTSR